ncbi:hypothetical protein RhiirA5_431458 [Rhizophagus irregularis]|uniref:Uncharacterized protein n=2 Tax=Rhizophagus irregularis TaxID=588596 RepID=U9TPZ0_RHIID|nr:hypothetical protein GLOIN_2v1792285 [Rhizophagus irregularis DAOM 181602=DAOM 197198]XP_025164106.1 hypothetical protein GLOIN_2v1792284 [Rhizophagus irregularis DAOM 181602=DAOM 197198]PKB98381.1 hypothetical protein RhiirA5_431458 [Rhizophagus irregularis]POG53498.1 hypothetical protein GLOIN_2v1792285 [Rhizophagus irregularis DAOM 181602=DAOM 197198]POG53499.1 hypothetical protein GLOIN_2v1792284 [Rhizophagus irregularis DAOM 181602=DAOM 197198]UZO23597.1 hypothetical protein OCT59_0159|eukprot:XP_025164105.1 hypothetical protein GLOIN_2v1792285 [Rhizophagus irregularis DAOM 181602=DAOM 197198]
MAQSTNDRGKKNIVKQIGNIVKLVSSKIKKSKAHKDSADDDHNDEQSLDPSTHKVVSKSFGNADIYYDEQDLDDYHSNDEQSFGNYNFL